jgi:predicted DNA-binding transcriptional regulator YafY
MTTRLMLRTERLVAIEQLLFHSESGMRAVELAEACGVDRRTVYRDLSLLNEIGVPISQKDGRFYLNREHYVANVRLSFDELLALVLSASALLHHAATPHLMSAVHKLSRSLPQSIRAYSNSLLDAAHRQKMDGAAVEILDAVARAWGDLRKIKLWYEARDGARLRLREVATYFIELRAPGHLYLIGQDSHTRKVQAFPMSRIKRVKTLDLHYEIPAPFSLGANLLFDNSESVADRQGAGAGNH